MVVGDGKWVAAIGSLCSARWWTQDLARLLSRLNEMLSLVVDRDLEGEGIFP